MQVKQRLRINAIISAVSVLVILLVLFLTIFRVNRALEALKIADAIITASYERLMLRTDFYQTGSERSKAQLIAKHGQIGGLLKAAAEKFPDPEDKKTVQELLTNHESIGKLSRTIRTNREKRGPHAPPDSLSLEIEDRLFSQLNMRVYETILLDSKLQESGKEAVSSALGQAGGGILFVLLLVSSATLINSRIMGRSIADRVQRLRDGAASIGEGNLEHRIDIKGDDEFAELSETFNAMTAKLRGAYDELEQRVEERTKELIEAEKVLKEMNESLERRVAERTAELQAANASLRDSRRAALNMMEDAVAARKLAEEAGVELQLSEARYRTLFETMNEGFCTIEMVFDTDGKPADYRFLDVNQAFEKLTGLHNAQGKLMRDLAPDHEAHWFEIYGKVALSGEPEYFENEAQALGRYYDVCTYRIGGPESRKLAILFNDITDRKRAEEVLRKANEELESKVAERTMELASAMNTLREETTERIRAADELRAKEQLLMQQSRLAAMGEMIGNIAHQWRQPLNTLGLIIQELPMVHEPGNPGKREIDAGVDKAMRVISHMSQTIDDFRNFFRPDKEMITFKVNDVVIRTVALIEGSFREQQIEIDLRANDSIFIHGYPNEYSQVVLNILVNARDAFVERATDPPRVVRIRLFRENGKGVLTIGDNAGGIAEDIMEKIFDPYFTTKGPDKGTGVGLFMAKVIIEKNMAGRLSAANSGNGAEFRIEV